MKTHQGTQTRQVADDALNRRPHDPTGGSISGTTTLTAGLSPPISADLAANSIIYFSLANPNGSTTLGIPSVGTLTPGQPGTFQVKSREIGTPGTTQAGDASTYNYLITTP
jgi:hypothetical protein